MAVNHAVNKFLITSPGRTPHTFNKSFTVKFLCCLTFILKMEYFLFPGMTAFDQGKSQASYPREKRHFRSMPVPKTPVKKSPLRKATSNASPARSAGDWTFLIT